MFACPDVAVSEIKKHIHMRKPPIEANHATFFGLPEHALDKSHQNGSGQCKGRPRIEEYWEATAYSLPARFAPYDAHGNTPVS